MEKALRSAKVPRLDREYMLDLEYESPVVLKLAKEAKVFGWAMVPKLDKEYMSGKEYMSVRVLQESHFA